MLRLYEGLGVRAITTVTHPYGVRDVERLLQIPAETLRGLVKARFVSPARGARNALRFSFQDLIVLRTAQALVASGLSHRKINKAVKALRAALPESMPLSGLSIGAVADEVVVTERGGRWQAESGQYLLEFEGDPAAGTLSVVERKPTAAANEDWFGQAVALERTDFEASARAYRKAIDTDPSHADAWINLGLLLHENRRLAEALRIYMEALDVIGAEAVLLFNLGVLLEDMQRRKEAVQAYEGAVRVDPGLADGHYNLALLYERLGKPREALRHMSLYRRLGGKS